MTINDWLGWMAVVWDMFSIDTAVNTIIVIIIAIIGWRWLRGRGE